MTYNDFITNIINTRGRFVNDNEYHERHHITPRCLNGTDDEDNLIDLYAHEHFIAHKLLAEENYDNEKLQFAFWSMSIKSTNTGGRYALTPEEYEEAKIALSRAQSKAKKELFKNPQNHPMYGKQMSSETRKKQSEAKKDKPSPKKGVSVSEEEKARLNSIRPDKWSEERHKNKMEYMQMVKVFVAFLFIVPN